MKTFWLPLTENDNSRWRELVGLESDADGRFLIELEANGHLDLRVAPPGLVSRRWVERSLRAGADRDMRDLVLDAEAVLTVSVVDTHGALLTQGWSVEALVHETVEVDGTPLQVGATDRILAPIDSERGSVRLASLPRGQIHLVAHGPEGVESNKVNVSTAPGTEGEVQLVYNGLDPVSFVVIDVRAPERLYGNSLYFRAANGTQRSFTDAAHGATWSPSGGWSIRVRCALEGEGPWTLESFDQRFRVASQPELRPGARLTVDLVGSAALALEIVDAETGEPIEAPTVEVVARPREREPSAPLDAAAHGASDGPWTNLVPGEYRVTVTAADFAEHELFVMAPPRNVHTARIELKRPVTFAGQLIDREDAPIRGATVTVERGMAERWDPHRLWTVDEDREGGSTKRLPLAVASTSADGRFQLAGLAPGPLTLRIDREDAPSVRLSMTHLGSTEHVVRVAQPARIEAIVDVPLDARTPPLAVALGVARDPDRFARLDPSELELVPLASDGSGSLRAVLFAPASLESVTVVRAEDTAHGQQWIPVGRKVVTGVIGATQEVRFDGGELLPATVRLIATASASPAVTSLRAPWLALGLQRACDVGEAWRRSGLVTLPLPPESLAEQPLSTHLKVPAGEYVRFVGGPGWRCVDPEPLQFTLLQSTDAVVDVDPPLVAREVRLQAADGTPLARTGVHLWFSGVHPLPPGERSIPVTLLTDEAGRFRAIGPVGATLHASVARDESGAVARTRPTLAIDGPPPSDGSAVMTLDTTQLALTVRIR